MIGSFFKPILRITGSPSSVDPVGAHSAIFAWFRLVMKRYRSTHRAGIHRQAGEFVATSSGIIRHHDLSSGLGTPRGSWTGVLPARTGFGNEAKLERGQRPRTAPPGNHR